MQYDFSRRQVIIGLGAFSLMLLSGCDDSGVPHFKFGRDLSETLDSREFKLKDGQGKEVTLADFRGRIPMVFFGFTQCPAICPTTLSRAVKIKRLLGKDGDRLQVIFITLDPERDTPQMLDAYVHAFDPAFIGLSTGEEQTRKLADEYKVYYKKEPVGESYTISHTATSYVFDATGKLRLSLAHNLSAEQCAEDLRQVMKLG